MSSSESKLPQLEGQPTQAIRLQWGQASDPGRDPEKQINEDSAGYGETSFGQLFVVCDGMGGHAGGRQASDTAIRTIFDQMAQSADRLSPRDALQRAVEVAAKRVFELGGPAENYQRPGSTCVALLLHRGGVEVAHVGDSRAYTVRGKRISRLTRDHSMVQELVDAGSLTEEEAAVHPDANKITRALGMTEEVEVELRAVPLELYADDIFVLATDGLTDLVSGEEILHLVLGSIEIESPDRACNDLVALANDRGGHDNITVQVVRVRSTGPKRSRTLAQEPSDLADESGPGVASPAEPLPGDDTVPDDGIPTFVEPSPSDSAPTKIVEPRDGVATTAPETPTPTIPGAPRGAQSGGQAPAPKRVATTAPERPQPTVVDPVLADQHAQLAAPVAGQGGPPSQAAFGAGPTRPDGRRNPLMVAVVVMAVIIGLLLTLLAWMMLGS